MAKLTFFLFVMMVIIFIFHVDFVAIFDYVLVERCLLLAFLLVDKVDILVFDTFYAFHFLHQSAVVPGSHCPQ